MTLYWNYEKDNLKNLIQASKHLDYQEIHNNNYMSIWIENLKLVILHIDNNNCLPNDNKLKKWIIKQNYEYKHYLMNNITKYIVWGDFLSKYEFLFNKTICIK
jgi:hypothetical protein